MIVLDTNVLAEAMRPAPAPAALDWLESCRADLHAAAEAMFADDFAGRILPFDSEAARLYPVIAAWRQAAGRPIPHFGYNPGSVEIHS